jgi:hypothetical protein
VKPGEFEIIPQNTDLPEIGAVIGWGKTIKQAHDMACAVAKEVRGTYIDIDTTVLDVATQELDKAASMGLDIR